MLLSKSCVYGLRASLYLASKRDSDYYSLKEMSEELDISFHFLTKILQQLTADGLMESYKGPNGGVRLSEKGKKSTLLDMVIAIDGPGLFTQCALGLPGCGSQEACPLHDSWIDTRQSIENMLKRTTLKEIAKEGKEKHFRLTAEGQFSWQ
ncbi:RrF2 family transcriptional regulator [Gracilimonas sp.]|uniref:RrF2 family transcriptional regulator n=1 Tax=Gracilimonas sp. TaxID=1974203 RepID=UPI0028719DBD|nr:Rrf2 family transcriptional regulator [Gracilimonas sp.]